MLSLIRRGRATQDLFAVAFNFTPVPQQNYRVGVPLGGFWRERLNTDAAGYGGGDSLLLLLNAHHEAVPFRVPGYAGPATAWELLLDTFDPRAPRRLVRRGHRYVLRGRSLSVLRLASVKPRRRRSAEAAAAPGAP